MLKQAQMKTSPEFSVEFDVTLRISTTDGKQVSETNEEQSSGSPLTQLVHFSM